MTPMKRGCLGLVAGVFAILAGAPDSAHAAGLEPQPSRSSPSPSPPHRALLDRYCVTCHNESLRTADLTLDTMDLASVSAEPATWEKVVRRLRTGTMPPAGRPRPDHATADALALWLETELDRAAERPNPGREPTLHRLNRNEYRNVIRDLLALEDLPRELDVDLLLPADDSTDGFDNIAAVLRVSPTLLERYMAAARKVSRLAVGDPAIPLIVDTYTQSSHLPQDDRLDGLPFGTRGGMVIRSHLPLDAEYVITTELYGNPREPHQIEISVDGERVQLFAVEPDPDQSEYDEPTRDVEVRLSLKAGPRTIAATFLKKTSAPGGDLVRPFRRGRGQQPSVAGVTVGGPYDATGVSDTPTRRRIFVCRPTTPADEAPCARQILSTLARRAYRRAVTDADLELLLPFYTAGQAEGGFDGGIQRALERILVSPQFLFRIEHEPVDLDPNTVYRISDLELASRVSFFLWSSIPDDELLDVASRGLLREPDVLRRQVRRMMADPRSQSLVHNFAAQWLYLRELINTADPYDRFFPNFDDGLRQAFVGETERFFESILREDRGVLDLLSADYTFVNERLAKHYGIPHVYGSHFRRATLGPDHPRRGLLGHGSILTLTSYPTRTSPVVRGKWVLENLLGTSPPPPPPDVPALEATNAEGAVLSMRGRMVQHRANPVCASCHRLMDPIGLSLEQFDAVGTWRAEGEDGATIDASGALPGGVEYEGPAGLRQALLSRPELFVTTVTEKLLTYALGRRLEYYDVPAVRTITRDAALSGYRLSSLIVGVVESIPFQMRSSQP